MPVRGDTGAVRGETRLARPFEVVQGVHHLIVQIRRHTKPAAKKTPDDVEGPGHRDTAPVDPRQEEAEEAHVVPSLRLRDGTGRRLVEDEPVPRWSQEHRGLPPAQSARTPSVPGPRDLADLEPSPARITKLLRLLAREDLPRDLLRDRDAPEEPPADLDFADR